MTVTRGMTTEQQIDATIKWYLNDDNNAVSQLANAMNTLCPEVQYIDAYAILKKIVDDGVGEEPYKALHDSIKQFFLIAKLCNSDYVSEFKTRIQEEAAEYVAEQQLAELNRQLMAEQGADHAKKKREEGEKILAVMSTFIPRLMKGCKPYKFNRYEKAIEKFFIDYHNIRIVEKGGIFRNPFIRFDYPARVPPIHERFIQRGPSGMSFLVEVSNEDDSELDDDI